MLIKVLSGEKTQTRRKRRPNVKLGGEYRLRKGYSWLQTRITVTGLYRQRLGEVIPEDVRREGFDTLEEFRDAWAGIYGGWDPGEVVWVVDFVLTETFKERP
ncbi:MAG: ASCH domain-containing protein [Deltaproteobacteria bacterium]|nr:ASCH domain-containing protein [Deltaproteobacteria bacterium]